MQAPWIIYAKQIKKLFENDKDVTISLDEYVLELKVEGPAKADALRKLLPEVVNFGNIDLKINVIPANQDDSPLNLYKKAFEGNPIVKDIISREEFGAIRNYVLFKKQVVQYENDDISDANRICSTLYQEIAKEIFTDGPEMNFCTSTENY